MEAIIESLPYQYFETLDEARTFHLEFEEIVKLIKSSESVDELKDNFYDKKYELFKYGIQSNHMWIAENRLGNRVIIVHYPKKYVSVEEILEANDVFSEKLKDNPDVYSECDRPNFISGYLKL